MCITSSLRARVVAMTDLFISVAVVIKLMMELHGVEGSGSFAVLVGLNVEEFYMPKYGPMYSKLRDNFTSEEFDTMPQINYFVLYCFIFASLEAGASCFLLYGTIVKIVWTVLPWMIIKLIGLMAQVAGFIHYLLEADNAKADVLATGLLNFVFTVLFMGTVWEATQSWPQREVPYARAVNEDDNDEGTELSQRTNVPLSVEVGDNEPQDTNEGANEPQHTDEGANEPQCTGEGATEPQHKDEVSHPQQIEEEGTEPKRSQDGVTEPQKIEGGGAEPQHTEEGSTESQHTEEGATEPQPTTETGAAESQHTTEEGTTEPRGATEEGTTEPRGATEEGTPEPKDTTEEGVNKPQDTKKGVDVLKHAGKEIEPKHVEEEASISKESEEKTGTDTHKRAEESDSTKLAEDGTNMSESPEKGTNS